MICIRTHILFPRVKSSTMDSSKGFETNIADAKLFLQVVTYILHVKKKIEDFIIIMILLVILSYVHVSMYTGKVHVPVLWSKQLYFIIDNQFLNNH